MNLKEIIKNTNSKNICWYPSSGSDIQIIDKFLKELAKIEVNQKPDLFIFTDLFYDINKEGILLDNDSYFSDALNNYEFIGSFKSIDGIPISNIITEKYRDQFNSEINRELDLFAQNHYRLNTDDKEMAFNEVLDHLIPESIESIQNKVPNNVLEQERSRLEQEYTHLLDVYTGSLYKFQNTFLLFISTNNNDFYSYTLSSNINFNSVIINRYDNFPGPLSENNFEW